MSGSTAPAVSRLENQIAWYDGQSRRDRKLYAALKGWSILASTIVPLLATFGLTDPRVLASLTATIALSEAIQQFNRYQANWLLYRSTCEALQREKERGRERDSLEESRNKTQARDHGRERAGPEDDYGL